MIVEPTSGNTGIALAMVCAARGYELILTLPEGMSRERAKLLRAYGAEVHETPSLGRDGRGDQSSREEIVAERGAFMPQQFSNPANPEIHRRTTAEEIWRDLDGEVDALRHRRRHRRHDHRRRPGAEASAARAFRSSRSSRRPRPVLSGGAPGPHKIQGIGAGFVPEVLDRDVIDEVITVDDETRWPAARAAAEREGLLVGISAGRRASAPRSRSPPVRRWPASGSSRSPATAASATCRCHSSSPTDVRPRDTATGRSARSARDVAAARDRDPAARGVGDGRDPLELGRGPGAARPPASPTPSTRPACRSRRGRSPSPAGR